MLELAMILRVYTVVSLQWNSFKTKQKQNKINGFGGVWRGSGGGRCCKHQVNKAFVVNGAELGLVSICCASFVMLCMRSFSTSSSSFFLIFFFQRAFSRVQNRKFYFSAYTYRHAALAAVVLMTRTPPPPPRPPFFHPFLQFLTHAA